MKGLFRNAWIANILRIALGGVFVYAGSIKIQNFQALADSIASFEILPISLISVLALALPPFEIILGMMLIFGLYKRLTAFSALIVLGIFSIALVQGLIRGLEVDCGCFGSGQPSTLNIWLALGRDVGLLVVALYLYFLFVQPVKKTEALPGSAI